MMAAAQFFCLWSAVFVSPLFEEQARSPSRDFIVIVREGQGCNAASIPVLDHPFPMQRLDSECQVAIVQASTLKEARLARPVRVEKEPKALASIQLTEEEGAVRIDRDGMLLTRYCFAGVPRPFLYPLIGPSGLGVTRNFPMGEEEGEEKDHPHHRSLWFSFGSVNGVDFWAEDDKSGRIEHVSFTDKVTGPVFAALSTENRWVAPDGTVVCSDVRTVRVYGVREDVVLDFDLTLRASHGELTLGDTKEGMFAVRVAETMRVKGPVAKGHLVNSKGLRDGAAWGKRAQWCDYVGPVGEDTIGVAIFDHPGNFRHPTYWHVRDYGLFAVNPFGLHDFENRHDEPHLGDHVVPEGESLTFRYRVLVHRGDTVEAKVADQYEAYASVE